MTAAGTAAHTAASTVASTVASTALGGVGRRGPRGLAVMLIGGALLSKALGLVREVLVARTLGATMIADSFRGGLTAVLLPLAFLQNESVPAILIPAYRVWMAEGVAPRRFAALTAGLVAIAVALCLLVEAAAPLWIDLLLAGFSEPARMLTLAFTRVMALAMPASVLLTCLSATEIARGQSRITSVRAALQNIAVIAGLVILLLTGQAVVLAWAFSLAFNAVAAWALLLVLREGALDPRGIRPGPVLDALREYFVRLRPLILQPVAEHGQIWIERLLASSLAVGTLASLDYARTLSDCAVLLVSQPLGLAVLSAGPSANSPAQMDALARPVLALAVPGSVFLVLFAPEVVDVMFHRGAFNAAAIASTSQALQGIATGLWAATLGWILVRMLNSAGRNRQATLIVAVAYLANIVVGALLVQRFGGLALGLGEAARGVALLAGVSLALGCFRHLLRLLAMALPGAMLLLALSLIIHLHLDGVLARLVCGSLAAACTAGLSFWLMVPGARLLVRRMSDRVVAGLAAGLRQAGAGIRPTGVRGCCLTFHRAAKTAEWAALPNRPFYLDIDHLERLLRHLQRAGWDIVTLDEAVRRMAQPGSRRFVNISIDDCYRDTAELVVPLFRRLGVPVTLFVTTGIPDGTLRLRDAGLETILLQRDWVEVDDKRYRLADAAQRRAAYHAISRSWDKPGAEADYDGFCRAHGFDPDALDAEHRITWPMLQAFRDDPFVEIGGHTVSHPHVASLGAAAAAAEIGGCRTRLLEQLGGSVRHFAFPYGRQADCGARDFGLVRQAGYVSGATTCKGLVGSGDDRFRLRRNTLNGRHRALPYVYAHLTGLSGLATRVLRRG
ncbi:MAG: lipid II flippase MurJ [Janthinobacterium lividum]